MSLTVAVLRFVYDFPRSVFSFRGAFFGGLNGFLKREFAGVPEYSALIGAHVQAESLAPLELVLPRRTLLLS